MQRICTTEKIIDQICSGKSNNIWYKILLQQQQIIISVNEGNSWKSSFIDSLHKSGKTIIPLPFDVTELSNRPDYLDALADCIMLLDIPEELASNVSRDYGVCCLSARSNETPYIADQGWPVDTSDPSFEKSWSNFYYGSNRNCTSAILIDRFLFSKEWNKGNGCPDEDISDCLFNVKEILDNIIPFEVEHDKFTVTLIFATESMLKCEKLDTNGKALRDAQNRIVYEYYTFQEIVNLVQNVKNEIYRPFNYSIELIGINKKCAYYNDTHDRYIITNFSTTTATQKLVAFNSTKEALHKQMLYFSYLYSFGLNGKGSIPAVTKDRVTESLKQLIKGSSNTNIEYALNGVVGIFHQNNIKNRLLKI